jgi:hypothetical protein
MKINILKEFRDGSLLSHMVLHNLEISIAKKIAKEGKTESGIECDVKLTVNGIEIDLESFIEHWQSQVHRMIKEEAIELVKEKFADLNDMLYDLEERIKPEIENRLEDWEKEYKDNLKDEDGNTTENTE